MSVIALIMMIVTQGIVIAFSAFYFIKILKTPPKADSDTYSENVDVKK